MSTSWLRKRRCSSPPAIERTSSNRSLRITTMPRREASSAAWCRARGTSETGRAWLETMANRMSSSCCGSPEEEDG